jgi:Sulfotransferase family
MTAATRPIVIVGVPRSGTSWTMRALGNAVGATNILEPDSEDKWPSAIHAKRNLGRYPVLTPGDEAPAYRRLWSWTFDGAPEPRRSVLARHILGPGAEDRIYDGRLDPVTWLASTLARDPGPRRPPTVPPAGPRMVAKSIHAQLAVEWIAAEFDIDVLLLLRHPANVLASWMAINLKDSRYSTLEHRPDIRARYVERWGVPMPGPDPVERMSWMIGLLLAAIEETAARHPDWHVRTHEQLCADPMAEFRQLYADLGLVWGGAAEDFLVEHNTPGSGFAVKRVASELPDSWRQRLDDDQLTTLRRVLGWFPLTTWTDRDFVGGTDG